MSKHEYDISWSNFDTKPHVTDIFSNNQSKPTQIARSQGLSVVDLRLNEQGEYVELPKGVYAYRPNPKPARDNGKEWLNNIIATEGIDSHGDQITSEVIKEMIKRMREIKFNPHPWKK